MKPNLTNMKKVADKEISIDELNIEVYYEYIPYHIMSNAITSAVSNSIVRYEDEVRILTLDANVLFETLLLAGCTNVDVSTIHSKGQEDPFTKTVSLYEVAQYAGIIDIMKSKLKNFNDAQRILISEIEQTLYLENQKFLHLPDAIDAHDMLSEIGSIVDELSKLETSMYGEGLNDNKKQQ